MRNDKLGASCHIYEKRVISNSQDLLQISKKKSQQTGENDIKYKKASKLLSN